MGPSKWILPLSRFHALKIDQSLNGLDDQSWLIELDEVTALLSQNLLALC